MREEEGWASYWLGRLAESDAGRAHVPEGPVHHYQAALYVFERLGFAGWVTRVRAALRERAPGSIL